MSEAANTFVRVDDAALVKVIQQATTRLVFVAPGVRKSVATAIANAIAVVPTDFVHIVLDVDAEVCRLGYGSIEGLEQLQAAASQYELTVNHHPGIRIGLLIADDTTLIYSPTPFLIEGGSQQPAKPNAIMLRSELPGQLADACALGEARHEKLEVGKDPIDEDAVAAVKNDLAERPAKKFNVARVERVFSSLLQYVEFRIEDYRLTTRSMLLNPELFGVRNEDIIRRLTNRYHLFADTDSLTVEIPVFDKDGNPDTKKAKEKFGPRSIDQERNRIKKLHVIDAGDFGSLILRRNVPKFEEQIVALKRKIEAYKTAVAELIKKRTDEIVEELLKGLMDRLKADPPDRWRSRSLSPNPTESDIKRLFEEDVRGEVENVKTDFNPRIFTAYKEVTYETFKDAKFRELIEDHFGKEAIQQILSEYDAAPEQDDDTN